MIVKFNKEGFRNEMKRQVFSSQNYKDFCQNKVEGVVEKAQDKMYKVFNEHRVTEEIRGGPTFNGDSVISYANENGQSPNLYSFIGFDAGETPLEELKELLQEPIEVKLATRKDDACYFKVFALDRAKIGVATPMPDSYATNNFSWAIALEDGSLYGIEMFMAKQEQGRSTGGIQIKGLIGSSIEKPQYVSEILEAFSDYIESRLDKTS